MAVRVKTSRLVVTFPSTADAVAAEKALAPLPRTASECGRLIPIPRSVSAGCGMAWKDEITLKEAIRFALTEAGIETEGFYECDFLERQT